MSFSEEQVRAAAEAAYKFDAEVSAMFGKPFDADLSSLPQWAQDTHLDKARAVLEAAAVSSSHVTWQEIQQAVKWALPAQVESSGPNEEAEWRFRTARDGDAHVAQISKAIYELLRGEKSWN